MALFASNILVGFIWTCVVVSVVINIFCLMVRLLQKRECSISNFFLHNLAVANLLVTIFLILAASMDASFPLDTTSETLHKYQLLCNLTGFIGAVAFNMTLTILITMSTDLLLRKLFPRKFRRTKNYLPFYRVLFLAEWVLVCAICSLPYLPVQYFQPTVQHYWGTLCLPLRPPQKSLWIYTLSLFGYTVFSFVWISLAIIFIIFQLQRQKNLLIMAIPMEARVIRREIIFAKRFCFIILATTLCWIPVLVIGFNAYAGSSISESLIQWIFGFVLPIESIVNPLLYLVTLGAEQGRVGLFLHSCKQKVSGSGNTLKLRFRQLTGSVSMTRDMYRDTGDLESRQIESLQRLNKPPPSEVKWLETLRMAGIEKGKPMFGKIEWISGSNAVRKGMIKLFSKSQYKRWKNEISTLDKIMFAGGHSNVSMSYWHSDNHKTIVVGGPPSTQSSILSVERYLCTPVFEHGNLRSFLDVEQTNLTDIAMHMITNQIADGLCFLHMRNILHNRIQATNILIGGNVETMNLKVVISEFGKAKDLSTMKKRKRAGTAPKLDESTRNWDGQYINVPGTIALKVFHDNEWAENVDLFVADIRAFAIMLCEMLLWSSTEACKRHLSTAGCNNRTFHGEEETAKVEGDSLKNVGEYLQLPSAIPDTQNNADISNVQTDKMKTVKKSLKLIGLKGLNSEAQNDPMKSSCYIGGGHRHHFVQSMPPPVFGDLTTKHLDRLLAEANNQVLEMEKESERLEDSKNVNNSDVVQNHRMLYDRKYRESLVNLLREFQEENDQHQSNLEFGNLCELTCPTRSLEKELSKNSRSLKNEKNKAATVNGVVRSGSDSSGNEAVGNDLFGLDSTNDLLQLLPDGSSKRKSICSTDSGISSQQESLSNFNPAKGAKKDQGAIVGLNNKVPGWSRHLHSSPLPTPFHFRNIPRSRTTIYAKSSTDNEIPSFSVLNQMIETWIQSHADKDCEYRSSILDGVQKSRANIPETIPETDNDKRYAELRKACSTGAIDDAPWHDEDCDDNSTPTTPDTKHKSSLSQFYVRKTGVKGTGNPAFMKATNKNIQLPVLYKGRQYSNHLYKKWRSADNVNIQKGSLVVPCPKCQFCGGHSPSGMSGCKVDGTDFIPSTPCSEQSSCAQHVNSCTIQTTSPLKRNHSQTDHNTPMISPKYQQSRQGLNMDASMSELCTIIVDKPDVQYLDCDVVLPSGTNKHHNFYLKELQHLFSWLPEATSEILGNEEKRMKAFSNWLKVLRRDKGYLHQQMVKIVERCWTEEPPLAAQEIKDLLLKCLPETPL